MSVVKNVLKLSKEIFEVESELKGLEEKRRALTQGLEEFVTTPTKRKKSKPNAKAKTANRSIYPSSTSLIEKEKEGVFNALKNANTPLTTSQILDLANVPKNRKNAVKVRVWSMAKKGVITKVGKNSYGKNIYTL